MTSTSRVRSAMALLLLACALAIAPPARATAATNPTITAVSPATGPIAGGTPVTITGTGFLPGATVYIGSAPASSVVVVSSTQITAVTPQGTQGSANVLVVNTDGGVGNATAVYFFTANTAALSISGTTPATGPIAGDTLVTITGAGFEPGATVLMGGIPASRVTWLGSSQIWAHTPPNSAGSVTVSVINPNGNSVSLAKAFTYDSTGGITITSVSPGGGLTSGGASVLVTGTGFAAGATVRFGATTAASVTFLNSTQLIAAVPAGSAGTVPVTVTNPNGTAQTLSNGFTYGTVATGGSTITGANPTTGPSAGGTTITLTGTGFTGGSTVLFGNAASPTVTYLGSSQLFVVTPPNNPGPATITLINSSGAAATLPGVFTYEGATGLVVTSVTPSSGAPAGGATVTITGTGFQTGATVLFGTTPAATATVVGSTQIVATAPAGAPGAVPVTVTNIGGLSATLPSAFTFGGLGGQPGPLTATSVTPNTGLAAGGTVVTIGGSGFVPGASVLFGAVPGTGVTVVNSAQITVTAPAYGPSANAISVTVVNPGGTTGSLASAFTYTAGGAPAPTPGATAPGAISLPTRGFGLFVFSGGTTEQLVAATGCPPASAAYYATNPAGEFVVYVPGTSIGAVNASWRVLFPASIPANTPLIGRCS